MKVSRVHEFGKALVVEDVPRPDPQADEVLVRVEACGVCHSDWHMIRGDWPDVAAKMTLPATLGHEVVGRVVERGTQARGIEMGVRVGVGWLHSTCGACEHCRDGAENVCLFRTVTGIAAPGGFGEYIRIKASHAIPIPENLPSEQAAPLFCAGLTVYHALRNAGLPISADVGAPLGAPRFHSEGAALRLRSAQASSAPTNLSGDAARGMRVAVLGIGGLGHLAVQLARHAGAEVTAVDVSEPKLALARACGASETVNASAADAAERLKADGGPHVAIVTAASKAAYDLAFRTLRRRGTLCVVGLPKEDLAFFADDWVVGEYRVLGSAVGTRDEMRELLDLAIAGKIRCEVETHRLDAINEVFTRLDRGQLLGRAVINFSD